LRSRYSGVQKPTISKYTRLLPPPSSKAKSGIITAVPTGIGSGSRRRRHWLPSELNRRAKDSSVELSYSSARGGAVGRRTPSSDLISKARRRLLPKRLDTI